jgi:chemotaxis methyl-accepting protein methylase
MRAVFWDCKRRNNLLTYCGDGFKVFALVKLTEVLPPGGFLMIGCQEKMPKDFGAIGPTPSHPVIFQKPG